MRMDEFGAWRQLPTRGGPVAFCSLAALEAQGFAIARLPVSLKVLLESLLRHGDREDVAKLARWEAAAPTRGEVPFLPARVLLQDFTGVPSLVDLAAIRSAVARAGGDPLRVEPMIPAELVVDHSVQVDLYGRPEALRENLRIEFERNRERYEFLKWGREAFANFAVFPPGVGICHQVNLEYLARVVFLDRSGDRAVAYPDSLVGTDSHTTMVNGLGVIGWGVGGIEAEGVMLGQPMSLPLPDVVGVRLSGALPEGATATDLALTVTERMRRHGVVGKFVEFHGPGLSSMSLPDRATIANMAPEYGATMGFFPLDDEALRYLRRTGRSEETVDLVERYAKEQGLFRTDASPDPEFTEVIELDLAGVEPSLAGPKRPQDRVALGKVKGAFAAILAEAPERGGFGVTAAGEAPLHHGSVVIAAITSCTNTSNPSVMLGAGLLARKALARGLRVPAIVKTSLAPGSRIVTDYLARTGLLSDLERLGFGVVAYGCTTCIGNSGPLPEPVAEAVRRDRLVVAAVLSGNRNFEGRIHPLTRANYLASPPLVVAYALAGRVDIDLTREPLGRDAAGRPVFLREIWPGPGEIAALLDQAGDPETYRRLYRDLDDLNPEWAAVRVTESAIYDWKADSTYIQEPPFLFDLPVATPPLAPIRDARVLALLGDSVTTDHISPAGSIPAESPAGRYLRALGVEPRDFNSYGARRGNDRVMVRGTFANLCLRNRLVPGSEGGVTLHLPSGERLSIFEAAERYRQDGVALIVIAGREYGTGSSRDWAAKGPRLLGVRAVLAESFERIHRSNLVGMGVLPLQFAPGESAASLGLTGRERFTLALSDALAPRGRITVAFEREDGGRGGFETIARIDTPVEVEYVRHGGILPHVVRRILRGA
jgi:aconitate hydratase